jgi:hypothetical protein
MCAQSRQIAKRFLQSSELGPTTPSPAGECLPSLFGSAGGGGAHSYAEEGVVGGFQFGRGYRVQTLWYSRFIGNLSVCA